jgi:hypothetical protein
MGPSLLLNYDAVVWNLFPRGWYGMTLLLVQRWIHSLGIVHQPNNHVVIAYRLAAINCEEQSLYFLRRA